jgi:hypothetical protein
VRKLPHFFFQQVDDRRHAATDVDAETNVELNPYARCHATISPRPLATEMGVASPNYG